MNKCYRLVFDEARGMLVPVAELKAARGKGRGRSSGGPRLSAVALLVASLGSECWPGTALAGESPPAVSQAQSLLPQSGRVVAGGAQIITPTADQMVIDQSSQRAVIDWQSFNIGAGDTVRFAQPSSTAQALNRVVGLTGTTQILGKLTANGQVFIVNPQGVVFGKGAVVDTAALLATTHDIAPSAFMAHGVGLLLSGGSNGTGLVDNEGTLSISPGGWVALVGDQVKNGGAIAAPGGTVALAAGAEATLALANGQLVSLKLDRAVANAQVIDSGKILANCAAGTRAGQVLISADTAQSLLDQAINITGVVQAGGGTGSGGTANRGGQITVDGGANGAVNLQNATLTVASAASAGGQVSVTGKQVTLYNSRLNASGVTGGGTILVGGGAHGSATSVAAAAVTKVTGGSSLDASATANGNGGQVVLWSNDRTDFGGTILSGGGTYGGNGGNVEVSSIGSVSFTGSVDTRAPRGNTGSLLLDPTNINVANGAAGAPNSTTVDGSSGSVTITDGEISAELANTSVTLSATGNITDTVSTVVSGVNASSVLTLSAANITLYGGYNVSGGVVLTGSRGIVFDGATIETGASNLTARANTVAFSGNTVIGGGSLNISGVNGVYAVTFSSGSVTNLSASSGSVLLSGNGAGGILMNAGSTINVVGNGTFHGTANGFDGAISVGCGTSSNASALVVINSSNGSLTLNGTNAHGDGIGISDVLNLSGNQTWLGKGTCGARGIDFGGLCNIQTLPYAIDVLSGTVNFSSPGSVSAFQFGVSATVQNISAGSGAVVTLGAVTGSPTLNIGGPGTVVFDGNNPSLGGSITVRGATLQVGSGGATGTLGTASVTNDGDLAFDLSSNLTVSQVIGGTGNLTQAGTGTLTLTGDNTYTGATSISAGTLRVGSGGATGTLGTASVTNDGNLTFDLSSNLTVSQVIGGTGNLTQAGIGTLTLTGNNTYTGATSVSAGTLQVGNGGTTGSLGAGAVIDDGAIVVNYGAAVSLSAVAACTSGITGNGSFTAVSTAALTIDQAINLSGGNGTVLLAAGCATAAGNAGGGDVTLTSPVSVGAGGTVTIFSGNPNTTTLEGQLSGASGATRYKTYDAGYGDVGGAVSGTHNLYYRGADSVSFSATGTLASKTYDTTADAAGDINAGAVGVFESVTDGNNISFSSLAAGTAAFNSPHALGVDGSTVEVSFGNTADFSASGANWSVAGLTVGNLSGTGTITPALLTLTATSQTRSYDGTGSAASLETVSGLVATDTLSNVALAEAYGSPHALGTDGSTLNVAAALTNASFASGSVGYITDYNVDYVTAAGTITPANLTITATSQTKTYDGTDGAVGLGTVSGLVSTDSLATAALAEEYDSPHVLGANGSTLNVTALTNASFARGSVGYITDYNVNYVTATGTISPANLTITAAAQTKTYDGTGGAAALATVSGLASTDSLATAALAEEYDNPHVLGANGSTLNVAAALTNASFASGSVGYVTDYNVDYVTAAGTITPANLTIMATAQTKTYDGTDGAAGLATVSGLVSTDSLVTAALTEEYDNPHVLGAHGSTLNVTALTNASFVSGSVGYITDYTVSYVTSKGSITPAALDVAPGSNLTLYDVPTTTLADMSGNVQPGQGYVSDYSPNVINNGNLTFAGPDDATLASLTGTGNLTVDANQMLTVTGALTEQSATVDGGAVLTYPGSGVAGQMQPVESGIGAVEWIRNGTMNDTGVMPGSSGISVVDGMLCTRPKESSKVCQ